MNKLFDVNNRFFSTLSKIWDLMVINFFFLITILAFVGPSCTAFYYAIVKNIRKSRSYPSETFFHSFKANFKQAAIIGIGQIIIGVGLYYSYLVAIAMNEKAYIAQVYYWIVIALIIVFAMVSVYIYPVLSRFTMKTGQLLRLSLYMSFRHFPTTLYGVVGLAVSLYSFTYLFLTPLVLIVPAVYELVLSLFMEKVLRMYMPKKEEQDENEQEAWYYE